MSREPTTHSAVRRARRIVVSSNCQTGGVAGGLQAIFPDHQIVPVPVPGADDHALELAEQLKDADAWVSTGRFDLLSHGARTSIQLVRIPTVIFCGFHPDVVHVKCISTQARPSPNYNSAIVVWAYRHNIPARHAVHLFNHTTFCDLGYLDAWNESADLLESAFRESDLDFRRFYLAMRRQGVFMHTPNHPKAIALVTVAKLAAQHLGAGADILSRPIDMNDGLNHLVWPLYPGIGESLALPSSYEWKMGHGRVLCGLEAYVESAYHDYRGQGISPDDLMSFSFKGAPPINEDLYDHVLGGHLRGVA